MTKYVVLAQGLRHAPATNIHCEWMIIDMADKGDQFNVMAAIAQGKRLYALFRKVAVYEMSDTPVWEQMFNPDL